ncbi:hypothetical protein TNCV_4808811 [Trichonephila clavipes]|nr:hypothetical protein TNCV_4808811 [Trichonephila clavipes]
MPVSLEEKRMLSSDGVFPFPSSTLKFHSQKKHRKFPGKCFFHRISFLSVSKSYILVFFKCILFAYKRIHYTERRYNALELIGTASQKNVLPGSLSSSSEFMCGDDVRCSYCYHHAPLHRHL